MPNNPQNAMNLKEVAALLGMSERTIYNWAQTKYIPAFKLGTSWRFKKAEILNWMETNRSGKTPDIAPMSSLDNFPAYASSAKDREAIKMKNLMARTEWRAKEKIRRESESFETLLESDHKSDTAQMNLPPTNRNLRKKFYEAAGNDSPEDIRKRIEGYLTNDAPPSQLDLDEILNLNYNYIQQFSSIESIIQGLNNYEDPFSVRDSVDRRLEDFPDNPYLRMLKFATEIICKGNEDTIITNLFAAIEFSSSQNFKMDNLKIDNSKKSRDLIMLRQILKIMENLIERNFLDDLLRDKIMDSINNSDRFDENLKKFIKEQDYFKLSSEEEENKNFLLKKCPRCNASVNIVVSRTRRNPDREYYKCLGVNNCWIGWVDEFEDYEDDEIKINLFTNHVEIEMIKKPDNVLSFEIFEQIYPEEILNEGMKRLEKYGYKLQETKVTKHKFIIRG